MNNTLSKILIILGLVLICLGLSILFCSRFKIPFLGRLPGDLIFRRGNFVIYLPLVSSLLISLIISLLVYLFSRR